MAEIRPFNALRFTPMAGRMEELACPPYDIISPSEREEYLARNPHNIIRLELPKEGKDPYQAAGETLKDWLREGTLACDMQEGLYVYEEQFAVNGEEKRIQGLVCRVRLEPFSAGVVLPHEETLSKAKEDRFRLMCATGCNFSSIYSLFFDPQGKVNNCLENAAHMEPLLDFIGADGIRHRVWQIADSEEIDFISREMADKKLYIADGHHRYETALRYRDHLRAQGIPMAEGHPANFIMMTLVPMEHPGLVVFPTHRVLHGLSAFGAEALLRDCEEYFQVRRRSAAELEDELTRLAGEGKKALALYVPGQGYVLELRDSEVMARLLPDNSPAYQQLDVNILHTLVLERLLGIDKENMAGQKNLIYTRDRQEAFAQVDRGQADCAFLLNPTGVEEVAAVAGAGEKMPQKSTYFYPKLITGHLMNEIL